MKLTLLWESAQIDWKDVLSFWRETDMSIEDMANNYEMPFEQFNAKLKNAVKHGFVNRGLWENGALKRAIALLRQQPDGDPNAPPRLLKFPEIATRLGMPIKNFKSMIKRAAEYGRIPADVPLTQPERVSIQKKNEFYHADDKRKKEMTYFARRSAGEPPEKEI